MTLIIFVHNNNNNNNNNGEWPNSQKPGKSVLNNLELFRLHNGKTWRNTTKTAQAKVAKHHDRKSQAKINRKMRNSTPCKIVTPENFIFKLCTRDDVGEFARHANFYFNRFSGFFSQNRRNITTLCLFDCPVLCCPVLTFFSILRPGRTAGKIFTLCSSNDVFLRKDGLFGVRMMGDHIWGTMPIKKCA